MPKIVKINIKKIDQVPDISSKICSYESLENLRMDISKYAIKGNRAIELYLWNFHILRADAIN